MRTNPFVNSKEKIEMHASTNVEMQRTAYKVYFDLRYNERIILFPFGQEQHQSFTLS
jgi:hypothetical protein